MERKWKIVFLILISLCLVGCRDESEEKKPVKEKKENIEVKIKDLTKPEIHCDNVFEIELNEIFNILEHINVTDNYDSKIEFEVTGEVNTTSQGRYKLFIQAIDKAGNASNKEVEVIVVSNIKQEQEQSKQEDKKDNSEIIIPSTKPSVSILQYREFLFSDGYNMMTGFDACVLYKGVNVGTCGPLRNAANMPYGYAYTP